MDAYKKCLNCHKDVAVSDTICPECGGKVFIYSHSDDSGSGSENRPSSAEQTALVGQEPDTEIALLKEISQNIVENQRYLRAIKNDLLFFLGCGIAAGILALLLTLIRYVF